MCSVVAEFKKWKLWFPLALVIITAVSLYDTYLIVKFSENLWTMEENPIGRWLLEINAHDVGVFVRFKLAGTCLVLAILTLMHQRRSRILFPVSTSVASYQVGLFMYLTVV